jgi:hypothetical protein
MMQCLGYGVLRSSAERPKRLLGIGLIAFDTKIIRLGMHGTFLEGIMIGVGKATSSRGQGAREAYFLGFLGDDRPGITETGCYEHR